MYSSQTTGIYRVHPTDFQALASMANKQHRATVTPMTVVSIHNAPRRTLLAHRLRVCLGLSSHRLRGRSLTYSPSRYSRSRGKLVVLGFVPHCMIQSTRTPAQIIQRYHPTLRADKYRVRPAREARVVMPKSRHLIRVGRTEVHSEPDTGPCTQATYTQNPRKSLHPQKYTQNNRPLHPSTLRTPKGSCTQIHSGPKKLLHPQKYTQNPRRPLHATQIHSGPMKLLHPSTCTPDGKVNKVTTQIKPC